MTITEAVRSGFRNATRFSGRTRRPDYWWFFLFVFAGAAVIGAFELALRGAQGGIVLRLFQLVTLLPLLALGYRRIQDTGRPGWWSLAASSVVIVTALIAGSVSQRVAGGALPAAPGGLAGQPAVITLALVLQIGAGLVIIWWMSRPSQRGANAYGPEPRVT